MPAGESEGPGGGRVAGSEAVVAISRAARFLAAEPRDAPALTTQSNTCTIPYRSRAHATCHTVAKSMNRLRPAIHKLNRTNRAYIL